MDGMVNICKLLINVVKGTKPKMLRGLSQKGTVAGHRDCPLPCHGHARLPANKEHLPRPCQPCGTWEARTAPFARKVGEPQGRPMAMRVWGGEKANAAL
jgi:hypothetical protein